MPGARPTISRPASSPPKERTGALLQSGYLPCSSWRKAASLGQRGQSGGGSSNGWTATGRRSGQAHQVFGRRLFGLIAMRGDRARSALRRIARDQRGELGELDEVV